MTVLRRARSPEDKQQRRQYILDRAWELSRRFDEHPVYDMVYVAVAERLGTQLITADAALRTRLVTMPYVVGPD